MIGCGVGLTCGAASAPAWSPADLSGKLLWLRADAGITLTSGHVTTWADQSGAGNDVTATGASTTQPIMSTWSSGIGGDAVYFDGNDTLATVGNILPTSAGAGFSIFIVGSFDDTSARCKLLTNATSGGIALSQNVGATGKLQRWKLGVAFDDDGASRTTPFSMLTIDQVGAAPGSEMYINGTLVSTTSPNGQISTPSGKLYIGASATSNFDKGLIRDVIVVSGRMSPATYALLFAYSLTRNGV